MASMMLTDCFSSKASRLIDSNRRNGALFPRWSVGQLCLLRTTVSGRGRTLSTRSSADAAMIIDDFDVGVKITAEVKSEVSRMKRSIGAVPGLAVILIGDRKYSQGYEIPCGFVGIKTFVVRLTEDSSEEEVLKYVSRFNDDPCVHGIIVPLPLPSHMNEQNILNAVSVEKDVDGFHSLNIGRLAMRGREPLFVPRAPKGCIELLHRYNFEIKGKRAVVIGRSNIFDMPVALLLQNPEEITRQADILISAAKQPNMVRGSWIKPGAVVINLGFTIVMDRNDPDGFRFVGDICYEEFCKVASAITPVAGTAGALTWALLLSNTLTSAKRNHNFM